MRRLATANAIFSALIVAFADSIGNDNTDNPSDHPFPLYSLSSLSFLFVYDKIDSFLTSSLKKHVFYNLLINYIMYLCVT